MNTHFVTRSQFRANQKHYLDEVGQGRIDLVITSGYSDADQTSFRRPSSVMLTKVAPGYSK